MGGPGIGGSPSQAGSGIGVSRGLEGPGSRGSLGTEGTRDRGDPWNDGSRNEPWNDGRRAGNGGLPQPGFAVGSAAAQDVGRSSGPTPAGCSRASPVWETGKETSEESSWMNKGDK